MWRPKEVAAKVELRCTSAATTRTSGTMPSTPARWRWCCSCTCAPRRSGRRGAARAAAEDGAFGCWTTDVPGRGKLSRDRLDSVSETLFLERQLNVLSRPGIRILDIGAGYGRFAYRMAQAHSSLADYCCVDAVPESTFLSEYYLGSATSRHRREWWPSATCRRSSRARSILRSTSTASRSAHALRWNGGSSN